MHSFHAFLMSIRFNISLFHIWSNYWEKISSVKKTIIMSTCHHDTAKHLNLMTITMVEHETTLHVIIIMLHQLKNFTNSHQLKKWIDNLEFAGSWSSFVPFAFNWTTGYAKEQIYFGSIKHVGGGYIAKFMYLFDRDWTC